MSAILLEGKVALEGSDCELEGKWHFFKDNKIPLNFRYKRVSNEVPLELVHFVSFISNGGTDITARPRSRGRVKGWRKYRASDHHSHASDAERRNAEITSSNNQTADDAEMDLDADNKEDPEESNVTGDEALRSSESAVGDEKQAEKSTDVGSPKPVILIPLDQDHPLFGLYVGSFDIKSNQGTTPVDETFFIHTYATNTMLPTGLDVLPPTDWWTVAQLLKYLNLDSTNLFADLNDEKGNGVKYETDTSVDNVEINPPLKDDGALPAQQINTVALSSGTEVSESDTTAAHIPPAVNVKLEAADNNTGPGNLVFPKPDVNPNLDFLLGFGRNLFGRFSLFIVYNRTTGDLHCERKYLTGRTAGLKKSIRHMSFSISSSNASFPGAGTPGSSAEDGFDARMTTRPHRAPSYFADELISSSVTKTHSNSERKHSRSYSTVSMSEEVTGPDKKRRRSMSSSVGDFHQKSSSGSTGRGRSHSTVSAAEGSANALFEMDRDFENPHNTTLRYRPVYFDEETGTYYEGWWSGGQRNGRGLCLYPEKLMYEGNWYMGRENGRGVLMTSIREVLYRGDWIDGCFQGTGTYNFQNGDVYSGDWREGKKHGKGEYFLKKYGCRYIGDWKDDKRHGKGIFLWADGSKYDGDWEKDTRHGRGTLTLANGLYYDGYWDHNFFDGRGCLVFPDGQEYQGMFKNGMRDGRGSVTFPAGAVYEGRFKEDKMDGQGTCKILKVLKGVGDEWMIPIEIQADMRRIHYRAGFGDEGH